MSGEHICPACDFVVVGPICWHCGRLAADPVVVSLIDYEPVPDYDGIGPCNRRRSPS